MPLAESGIIFGGGVASPVRKPSRPYPLTTTSTCYCHIRKLPSVSFTEIGGSCEKIGSAESGIELAFESFDSAIFRKIQETIKGPRVRIKEIQL